MMSGERDQVDAEEISEVDTKMLCIFISYFIYMSVCNAIENLFF